MANTFFYPINNVTLAFSEEKLPVNLKRLLRNLRSLKDHFKNVIVMADPMVDKSLGVPLWLPIKTTINQVRKRTLPEVKFMDSHLALYKKYAELENK